MKEGKGIMLEDGSIDITHLMDDKDIEIWEDIFKVKGRHKKRVKRFVKSLFKSSGGTEIVSTNSIKRKRKNEDKYKRNK